MAQAEDPSRTGVRRRRLDRAAAARGSTSARCCSASHERGGRRERSTVRRPHRHRLRPGGARTRVEAAEAARDRRSRRSATPHKTNEPAHWVRPELVAQVKFTEWTADGKLRHPVYLGLRDDKRARRRRARAHVGDRTARRRGPSASPRVRRRAERATARRRGRASRQSTYRRPSPDAARRRPAARARRRAARRHDRRCPTATRLGVTNLAKVFWPKLKLTKGDLLRYYADGRAVHPAGRRRSAARHEALPERRRRQAFYQQRAPEDSRRPACASRRLPDELDPIDERTPSASSAGRCITLLYMTQLAAISQDPWFSRVQSPLDADYVALDLDPATGVPFAQVLDVARWVRDELESLARARRAEDVGRERPAHLHPAAAGHAVRGRAALLPDRRDRRRGAGIRRSRPSSAPSARGARHRLRRLPAEHPRQDARDRLQRARERVRRRLDAADVGRSRRGVDPRDFTIVTAPARFREVGDLWARLRTSKPARLETVFGKYGV